MIPSCRSCARAIAVAAALALGAGAARAQVCFTARASVDSSGVEANGASGASVLSRDGRYVAFVNYSSNLVAFDMNNRDDVFVRDRVLMTTQRMSEGSLGTDGDMSSYYPSISADGRFVVFSSWAHNLIPNDLNNTIDVFLRDRTLGTIERLTTGLGGVEANNGSYLGSISSNGRFVAFLSFATNLVSNDVNNMRDVFLLDRTLGTVELVSVSNSGAQGDGPAGGNTGGPYVSDDGRFVAFQSAATNLVPGDTNARIDAFVRDRALGITSRLSIGLGGAEPDGDSDVTGITPDGRFIAIASNASNLVVNDTNGAYDPFLVHRETGAIERASVSSSGQGGSNQSWVSSISDDGRFVAFTSVSTDLVANDTNNKRDVFVRDRAAGTTELVSRTDAGSPVGSDCYFVALSGDGSTVAFTSADPSLVSGDLNSVPDVFVKQCRAAEFFCVGTQAACPCGNGSDGTSGCATAITSGAQLTTAGRASVATDTLALVVTNLPPFTSVAFMESLQPIVPAGGIAFGDGLRCLGGPLTIRAVRQAVNGAVAFGFVGNDPLLSVVGAVPSGGDYRHYQAWYRSADTFCTGAGFNFSNGATVLWGP